MRRMYFIYYSCDHWFCTTDDFSEPENILSKIWTEHDLTVFDRHLFLPFSKSSDHDFCSFAGSDSVWRCLSGCGGDSAGINVVYRVFLYRNRSKHLDASREPAKIPVDHQRYWGYLQHPAELPVDPGIERGWCSYCFGSYAVLHQCGCWIHPQADSTKQSIDDAITESSSADRTDPLACRTENHSSVLTISNTKAADHRDLQLSLSIIL